MTDDLEKAREIRRLRAEIAQMYEEGWGPPASGGEVLAGFAVIGLVAFMGGFLAGAAVCWLIVRDHL